MTVINYQPWAEVPRDGSWVLPYDGYKHLQCNGYQVPVQWVDDGMGGMCWAGDMGTIFEGLDDEAIGFFALPSEPTFSKENNLNS